MESATGKQQLLSKEDQLEWISLQPELPLETNTDKFKRKFFENPFVPIGCVATTVALSFGLYSLMKGNRKLSQSMMRARVLAQGFTITALVVGIIATYDKKE